jgi:hypothetical protein
MPLNNSEADQSSRSFYKQTGVPIMKMIRTLAVACVFCASSAYAVDPQLSDITCEQLRDQYELTAEAEARFAELKGSCEGVYDVNGALYVKTRATIRSKSRDTVRLYLPATDHTFEVTPDPDGRVWVAGRKMHIRDLNRGDRIGIYLSVDRIATEKVTEEVAFATEDDHVEEIVVSPVETVEALPTTG